MITLAAFDVSYPEFVNVPSATKQAKLAEAELLIGDAFGEQEDLAHGLAAADLLLSAPMGHAARAKGTQETAYAARLAKLRRAAGCLLVFP